MNGSKLAGGPTQDEVMAVSLFKLGLTSTDKVLEVGCGTGRVTVAMAGVARKVYSLDIRPEAVSLATEAARTAGAHNIEFFNKDALDYLEGEQVFDCAFLGGTKGLEKLLPALAPKVKRTIVINAVMLSTLHTAVTVLKELGLFVQVVQVQVSRSYDIAGSIMFRPIDPVFVIIARGAAC